MAKILVWACGGVLTLCLLVLFVSNWTAHQRETVEFGTSLPEQGRLLGTDVGAIFVLEKGDPDARRVLFAHGTAAWSVIWQDVLDEVATEGYRATAFDMPPFGWSEHPDTPDYSRTAQAGRVIAMLEAFADRPIVVAHSVGAGPVSEAVLLRPDLVSGYIIVSGALGLDQRDDPKVPPIILSNDTFRRYLTAATATNPLLTERFLRGFMYRADMASPEMVAALQKPMVREGYTEAVSDWIPQLFTTPNGTLSMDPEKWRALELPVALIWGDQDTVTPLSQGRELEALVPNATLTVLEDVGHIPHLEAPADFSRALLETLDKIADPSRRARETR